MSYERRDKDMTKVIQKDLVDNDEEGEVENE
jgi:hypothetical protein